MPKANVETVDHVAKLARLLLTDAERERFLEWLNRWQTSVSETAFGALRKTLEPAAS